MKLIVEIFLQCMYYVAQKVNDNKRGPDFVKSTGSAFAFNNLNVKEFPFSKKRHDQKNVI